jgi:hypothetical protein
MSEAAVETTQQQAPAAATEPAEMTLDQRASVLVEELKTEQKTATRDAESQAVEAKPEAKPEAPKEAPKEGEQKPEADLAAKAAEARRERLAKVNERVAQMAAEERERVARSLDAKPHAPPAQEPPGIRVTDAASLFAAAEKLGVPPTEFADFISRQGDPAKVAEHVARQHRSEFEKQLAEERAKREALERRLEERDQAAQVAQVVEQNRRIIVGQLERVANDAPLTSRLAEKATGRFWQAVDNAVARLPDGFTAQDVIDRIEEDLSEWQSAFGNQFEQPSTPKRTKEPAAAQANVGNRLAAERATVVDEDDEESLDLEERARKLKARLAAAG